MRNIKRIVRKLIKKHQTNDPFRIAKEKKIIVRFENLVNNYGYFLKSKRIKIIHINNRLNEALQRFVCAHELGHAVLHPDLNTPFLKANTFFSVDKIEVEANTFAVEVLLPDEYIAEYRHMDYSLYTIAKLHGVPKEVIHLKNIERLGEINGSNI